MHQDLSFELQENFISPAKRSQNTYDRLTPEPLRARFLSNHNELNIARRLDAQLPSSESLDESAVVTHYAPAWFFRMDIHKIVFSFWGVHFTRGLMIFCSVILFAYVLAITLISTLRSNKKNSDITGFITSTAGFLLFTFASKHSFWRYFIGLSFEKGIAIHKILAIFLLGLVIFHWTMSKYKLSGVMLLSTLVAIIISSFYIIRRKWFKLFYYSHVVLMIAFAGFAVWHGAALVVIGFGLWALDFLFRYFKASQFTKIHLIANIELVAVNIIELSFTKGGFAFEAGQYCFISIPEISMWELHPFSITSGPSDDTVRMNIKICGDWTKSLGALAKRSRDVKFKLDGPHGNLSLDIKNPAYKQFILVAGGIGVTPMLSLINSLIEDFMAGRTIRQIKMVWATRSLSEVKALLDERSYLTQYLNVFYYEEEYLKSIQPSKLIDLQIYLTSDIQSGEMIPATLSRNILYRKLQLSQIFLQTHEICKDSGDPKVAVFVCGPASMIEEARAHCKVLKFDLHCETFEL
jgi:predicted ferric reductase